MGRGKEKKQKEGKLGKKKRVWGVAFFFTALDERRKLLLSERWLGNTIFPPGIPAHGFRPIKSDAVF